MPEKSRSSSRGKGRGQSEKMGHDRSEKMGHESSPSSSRGKAAVHVGSTGIGSGSTNVGKKLGCSVLPVIALLLVIIILIVF